MHPNGMIEGYRLIYEPCTPVDGRPGLVLCTCKALVLFLKADCPLNLSLCGLPPCEDPIVCVRDCLSLVDWEFVSTCVFSCGHSDSGVSKIVTVDVKGSAPRWMKIKDLVEGVTYNFRIRAKTFTYGPHVEANITTGPGEGLIHTHLPVFLL